MIVISGTVEIKADKRQQMLDLARMMMAETAREEGNINYNFYSDIENENVFRMFEQWRSQEALEAHLDTNHMAELNRRLPELIVAAPELTRYQIAESTALTN